MGNSSPVGQSSATGSRDASLGHDAAASADNKAEKITLKLEDLELPPRRDKPRSNPQQGGNASMESMLGQMAGGNPGSTASSGAGAGAAKPGVTEEIFRGGNPLGQKAFQNDGLVGTETQQLSLLAHYAELCEDFRRYQRQTRADGGPRDAMTVGSQLLLLSGAPGTGKTQHAVSFSRALGLPLLMASPANGGTGSGVQTVGWSAQLRREVNGRDCVVFFDEIDQHAGNEAFASELRQFLDGVCQPSSSRVLLVGTTNRIDKLPEDVRHRAEVITFVRPQADHLAQMWGGYAQHLTKDELRQLSASSELGGITGRDVRHCASWAERHIAIQFLNANHGLGYCHGAALANCKPPPMEKYMRCVQDRSVGGMRPGVMASVRSWLGVE